MSARTECRHYASRTIAPQEIVQRCRLDVASSIANAHAELTRFSSDDYRAALVGALGRQPLD